MEQWYKRAADWGLVQQAASHLTVPVIGNDGVPTYYEVIMCYAMIVHYMHGHVVSLVHMWCPPGHAGLSLGSAAEVSASVVHR